MRLCLYGYNTLPLYTFRGRFQQRWSRHAQVTAFLEQCPKEQRPMNIIKFQKLYLHDLTIQNGFKGMVENLNILCTAHQIPTTEQELLQSTPCLHSFMPSHRNSLCT